jgi:hypothetical protein
MKKETAMQQHINWLKGCIELLDEQAPIMEKTLMLCLKDAESRLDAEKEQMQDLFKAGVNYGAGYVIATEWGEETIEPDFENYYNRNFKK